MSLEFILPFLILTVISWAVFMVIQKNITHITQSHLRILGKENKDLIMTPQLFAVKVLYFALLLIFTITGIIFFMLY